METMRTRNCFFSNRPDTAHCGTPTVYPNLSCFAAVFAGTPPREIPMELRIWRACDDAQFVDYDGALPGKVWRIGLMGHKARLENVERLLQALRETMKDTTAAAEAA
jgi:aspartate aminotransferase-like enzyme